MSSITRPRNSTLTQLLNAIEAQSGKLDLLITRIGESDLQKPEGEFDALPQNPTPAINCMASTQEVGSEEPLISSALLHHEQAHVAPFHGPASSTFLIGLAHLWRDQGLKNVDYPQAEADLAGYEILSMLDNGEDEVDDNDQAIDLAASGPAPLLRRSSSTAYTSARRRGLSLNALQVLTLDRSISLIRQYDDMIGARYPFLEVEVLIQQTKELYNLIEASSGKGDKATTPLATPIDVDSVQVLMMLLVLTLACNGDPHKTLRNRLFKDLREAIQEKLLAGVTNTKDLALLILVVRIN